MIILRNKYFSDEEKNKKRGIVGASAIGLAGAGLGTAGGFSYYNYAKQGLKDKRKRLQVDAENKAAELERISRSAEEMGAKVRDSAELSKDLEQRHRNLGNRIMRKKGDIDVLNQEIDHLRNSTYHGQRDIERGIKKRNNTLGQLETQVMDLSKEHKRLGEDLTKQSSEHANLLKQNRQILDKQGELQNLKNNAESKLSKFNAGFKKKLSRNKAVAIGIGATGATLGALGAYGYYKSKNK